jgi:osmotically inducible protein OsmC
METTSTVTLETVDGAYAITSSHLELKAMIPGADHELFDRLAAKAKAECPVSKLLKCAITLEATLIA